MDGRGEFRRWVVGLSSAVGGGDEIRRWMVG